MIKKHCTNCGKPITVWLYRLKTNNFCSRRCNTIYQHKSGIDMTAKAHQSIKENGQPKLKIGKRVFSRTKKWKLLRLKIIARDKVCQMCGGVGSTIDHIVPVQLGENNKMSNLQFLCTKCHSIKSGWDRKLIKATIQHS